jgi:hypothetical protein
VADWRQRGTPGCGRSALLEREMAESPTAICALDAARLSRKAVIFIRRIGPGRDRRLRGHGQTIGAACDFSSRGRERGIQGCVAARVRRPERLAEGSDAGPARRGRRGHPHIPRNRPPRGLRGPTSAPRRGGSASAGAGSYAVRSPSELPRQRHSLSTRRRGLACGVGGCRWPRALAPSSAWPTENRYSFMDLSDDDRIAQDWLGDTGTVSHQTVQRGAVVPFHYELQLLAMCEQKCEER